MDNNLGIDFAHDLEQVIDDLPNRITINSRIYKCVADEERRAIEVEEPGSYAIYERNVHLVRPQLSSVPAVQSTATLDSVIYYIEDVNVQTISDAVTLTLRREDGS